MSDYVHLHVHSHKSLLDSVLKVPDLVQKVKAYGGTAVAITDHGVMGAAIELYKECKKQDIKPIIGGEFYLSPTDDHTLREKIEGSPDYYHLVLLAKNAEGVSNLFELSSLGFSEGFYRKPRISIPLIEKYSKNLVCLGACIRGPVSFNLDKKNEKLAYNFAGRFKEIFREDFYLELMDHGLDWQKELNTKLVSLGNKIDISCVPTNDAHFLDRENHYIHSLLLCLQLKLKYNELKEKDMQYPEECYIKIPDEMEIIFGKDLCSKTLEVAEKIDIRIELGNTLFPDYEESNV